MGGTLELDSEVCSQVLLDFSLDAPCQRERENGMRHDSEVRC